MGKTKMKVLATRQVVAKDLIDLASDILSGEVVVNEINVGYCDTIWEDEPYSEYKFSTPVERRSLEVIFERVKHENNS